MDRVKLLAAIIITTMIIGAIVLMVWLTEITDWIFRIVFVIVAIVAIVYCNL